MRMLGKTPIERRRRIPVYAIFAGVFCLGLLIMAAAVGESGFVAKAVIQAGESQRRPIDLPFALKVPEPVLHAVVEAQGLADDAEFVSQRWSWISRARSVLERGHFASDYDTRLTQAVMALGQAVALKPSSQEGRLDVEVTSVDAGKTVRIANGLAEAILEDQQEQAREKEVQNRRISEDSVAHFAARLQMAKQRLADFQAAQNPSGDDTATIDGRGGESDPEVAMVEAKADVDRIARALATGQMARPGELHFPTPDLDHLTAQYGDLRLQLDKRKLVLGDKHPDIIALEGELRALQKEIHGQWQKAADIAGRNHRLAQARALAFGHEAQAAAENAAQAPVASLEKLRSDVDLARGDYEQALRQQAKAENPADMQPSWSITKAQAGSSAPGQPQGLILGAVLMLGSLVGAGRRLTSGRRHSQTELLKEQSEALDVSPRISQIPRIRTDWFREAYRLKPRLDVSCQEVLDRPSSDFSHAIEHLFELETDAGSSDTVKVLFVSKEDKLGATTVAVNFAHIAAKAGYRVLLIEANRRRPILASLISPKVRVNLIDLNGTKRIICQIRPRLSVIPLFDEETSIFLAGQVHHCVKGIGRHFDCVILDGGRFVQDSEMMEMMGAVKSVFYLTAQGIERKAAVCHQHDPALAC
jgi:polysaccharide biosynthesis transport protein